MLFAATACLPLGRDAGDGAAEELQAGRVELAAPVAEALGTREALSPGGAGFRFGFAFPVG